MYQALLILESVALIYFAFVGVYTLLFSFAGVIRKLRNKKYTSDFENKYAILIPAYKEDGIIVDVAQQALNQTYPQDLYDVYIIADSLQDATISNLKKLPVITEVVSFEKSTKVKALNTVLSRIQKSYDFAVILDADNVMKENFLHVVNSVHKKGFRAIQGRRAAKNRDNNLSYLDGLSEEINNHVFCEGSTALGLSSSLKGSGMSFDYDLFKTLLSRLESIGGFDRELEVRFIQQGVKVRYVREAVVYDEKVEKTEVFENQRKRWISSQFFYLRKYFLQGCLSLLKLNLAYFNSTVLRNIQLPRLIGLGLNTVFVVALFFVRDYLNYNYFWWLSTIGMTALGMILAIPFEYYNRHFFKSLLMLPGIFFKMFLLLFKLKGANKKFIHTPHGSSTPNK
ncbi:MAG: glycosyltransferase family 2 protein [Bacteroidota bacterium]